MGSTPSRANQGTCLHGGDCPAVLFLGCMARGDARILQGAAHASRGSIDPSEESFHRIPPASPRYLQGRNGDLTWSRELPIEGQPEDVVEIVDSYSRWLSTSPIPKLFMNGDPAGFLIGAQREFCRAWPNQQEITVQGAHFLQEDSPSEVGEATARFVAKVLAGQIS